MDVHKVQNVPFSFRLCDDVLLGVLRNGNRLQLSVLEVVAKRYHFIIGVYMIRGPYHLLEARLYLW